jgi:hypothetical protein
VCQAYDKHVAKGDIAAKYLSLSFLRTGFKVSNLLIDQWSLVQVGMFAVRDTKRECWTQSFYSCNLDPSTRVSFGEWCERIGHFLQGSEHSFRRRLMPIQKHIKYMQCCQHGGMP